MQDLDRSGRVVTLHRSPGGGTDYVTEYGYNDHGLLGWTLNAVDPLIDPGASADVCV